MRRPAESPGRVAEHRTAVGTARLVLAAPAHDVVDAGLARAPGRRRRHPELGADDDVGGRPRSSGGRRARARRRRARRVSPAAPVGEVAHPRAREDVARLATVAAGVHAHRATDRAGDPDEELEAGPARGGETAGEHREGDRRAGGDDDGPVRLVTGRRRRWRRESDPLEVTFEHDAEPGEAGVGDEQVRAAADDEHRRAQLLDHRGDRRRGRRRRRDPDDDRDRPAEAVGAELRDRQVAR